MKWRFWMTGLLGLIAGPLLLPQSNAQNQWQLVSQVLPEELQQQILQENLQPGTQVEIGQMRVLILQRAPQVLYLIDTRATVEAPSENANPLCGTSHCLFLVYRANQRVLNIYLNPKLPPQVKLIQPISQTQTQLPCLLINQLEQRKLHTTRLCFTGQRYEVVETQIAPEVHE